MRHWMAVATVAVSVFCLQAAQAASGWIEPNRGQAGGSADFVVRASDLTALLDADHVTLLRPAPPGGPIEVAGEGLHADGPRRHAAPPAPLHLRLVGANEAARASTEPAPQGVSHYFRGADREKWLQDVPHLATVRYQSVYPGIDVVYRLNDGRLQYDFELAPGADATRIKWRLEGARDDGIDAQGAWAASLTHGTLRQRAPQVFRVRDGQRSPIAGRFERDGDTMGFAVAAVDAGDAVVIDPVIEFSGYVGGTGADAASLLRQTADGDYVLLGRTRSTDLPGGGLGAFAGDEDIFVTRIDAGTGAIEWTAIIGGSGLDSGENFAFDSAGNMAVVGYSSSPDFPAVNAFQPTWVGSEDNTQAFPWDIVVFKLTAAGDALSFSTYLGGTDLYSQQPGGFKVGFEWARGVAVDSQDRIVVVGQTGAPDFPATTSFGGRPCMGTDIDAQQVFVSDIVVARFLSDGTRETAVCIGGTERDGGRDVQLGANDAVYVGGFGRSDDLPGTVGAFQSLPFAPFVYSPIVMTLSGDLSAVNWASYVGEGLMQRIAVDAQGNVYGTGSTVEAGFPVTPGAFQTAFAGGTGPNDVNYDGWVFKLAAGGATLDYATFLGGARDDAPTVIEVDASGRAYVAGTTQSPDYPLRAPLYADVGPALGGVETVLGISATQDLLILNDQVVSTGPAEIFIARDGVNQWLDEATPFGGSGINLGSEIADSEAVTALDANMDGLPETIVFANRLAPQHTYAYDMVTGVYLRGADLGGATGDSRDADALIGLSGFRDDLVVANYGQANEIVTAGTTVPVSVGRSDGNTTAVAVGRFGVSAFGESIVFGNEFQDVRLLPYQLGGSVGAPVVLSSSGARVSSLAAGDLDGDGIDELIIGNRDAPNQIVSFAFGTPRAPVDIDAIGDDTLSLLLLDADRDGNLDLLVGNAAADRLYLNDGAGNLVLDPRYDGYTGPTNALANERDLNEFTRETIQPPFLLAAQGLRRINDARIATTLTVLDPTGSDIEFSTYIETGAGENLFRGLSVPSAGRVLLAASVNGPDWPRIGRDTAYQGQTDAAVMVLTLDQDGDGVFDNLDNCLLAANPNQRDTNGDGFGNVCDADLNNDGIVNPVDLGLFRAVFFSADPDADFNGDGVVNAQDLGILRAGFFSPPGPSGLVP